MYTASLFHILSSLSPAHEKHAPGTPSFSTSTLRAASVGSPMRPYVPSSTSNTIWASLHTAQICTRKHTTTSARGEGGGGGGGGVKLSLVSCVLLVGVPWLCVCALP